MTHKNIYEKFALIFNMGYFKEQLQSWFNHGPNSIRLKMINGEQYIFTCMSDSDWKFETIKCFTKGNKK